LPASGTSAWLEDLKGFSRMTRTTKKVHVNPLKCMLLREGGTSSEILQAYSENLNPSPKRFVPTSVTAMCVPPLPLQPRTPQQQRVRAVGRRRRLRLHQRRRGRRPWAPAASAGAAAAGPADGARVARGAGASPGFAPRSPASLPGIAILVSHQHHYTQFYPPWLSGRALCPQPCTTCTRCAVRPVLPEKPPAGTPLRSLARIISAVPLFCRPPFCT
jgi:hypothetical protein